MINRRTTGARIYPETKDKFMDYKRELERIHKQNIQMAEVFRRMSNIPSLKDILISDAINKEKSKRVFK